MRTNLTGFVCAAIALLSVSGCGTDHNEPAANAVLLNGNFYLGSVRNPWASAIAITDGKIAYAGDDASNFIGVDTTVHDLDGRTAIPGLIDAHAHPGYVALTTQNFALEDTSSKENLMASIRALVADNPDAEILIAGFWPNEFFDVTGPRKEVLDEIEPDRPLILFDDWAHTVWANSAALDYAGVTRDTEDLVPGFSFYQKDEHGEPTGWITESAASVFINHFQSLSPEVEQALGDYLNYNRDLGITTLLDAGNFGLDREVLTAVSRLDQAGLLPVRYEAAYTLFVPGDLPTAVESLKQLGADFNSDNIRVNTMKVFFDGVLETRTAALSSDYLDTPGNSGEELLSREQLVGLILDLEDEQLNLHVHAVGDRAVTTILDAVQEARDSLGHPQTIRIAICHLEVVKDIDFGRFRELDVVANFTPHWWTGGDGEWVAQGIGGAALNMQRAQALISDGAIVTFSSDITDVSEWKSDRANPYLGIQIGHTRQEVGVGVDGEIFPPLSDRLRREDMINGYTTNAAYQLGRSDEFGTIAVGQRADLVILNQNVFSIDKYEIFNTKPLAVIVDGAVVSGSLDFAQP